MPYSHLIQALSYLSKELEKEYGMVEITGVSPDRINEAVREQVAKGVKRLIWIHANRPDEELKNAEKLFPLLSRMEQVVIYNYSCQAQSENEYMSYGIKLVGFDRNDTYIRVAETFRRLGHRKIALDEIMFDDRYQGLLGSLSLCPVFKKQGFEIYGICPSDIYEMTDEELVVALSENLIWQHKKNQVNCAFIRNDMMGAGIINVLHIKGIRVPEDIAVIGFGDIPLAQFQPVPLTTFRHPIEEMCAKTLELIKDNSSDTGEKYYFKDKFVIRKSHC